MNPKLARCVSAAGFSIAGRERITASLGHGDASAGRLSSFVTGLVISTGLNQWNASNVDFVIQKRVRCVAGIAIRHRCWNRGCRRRRTRCGPQRWI